MNANDIYQYLLSMETEFAVGVPALWHIPITKLYHYNILIYLKFIVVCAYLFFIKVTMDNQNFDLI
ncbi:hypothetical protein [Campylobacter lanienae]|uniref:hypothetical protein n=2 Tax=Campylobacter lanienae TaxID=75658 RepID=UPI0015D7B335|nr:hypothetical protein [Campylobacter lanienae]